MSSNSNQYLDFFGFQEEGRKYIPTYFKMNDPEEENLILFELNHSDSIGNSDIILNSDNIFNSNSIINSDNIDNSDNIINSYNIDNSDSIINSDNIDNSDNNHNYYNSNDSDNSPQQLPLTQKNENEPNCININNSNSNNPEENLNFNQPQILIPINSETPFNQSIKDVRFLKNKRSRKKKEKTLPQKSKEDRQNNKVVKIKTYMLDKYHDYINKLIKEKDETKSLCKLDPEKYSENINRNENLNLFDMSMKEVYLSADVTTKFKKKNKKDNEKVIEDVYQDPKIKKALDLIFRELLQIFIKNIEPNSDLYTKTQDLDILYNDDIDLLNFLTEVRYKFENDRHKPKSQQEIKEYIDGSNKETSIMDLCIHMETWFKEKDPRAKRGKKKQKQGKKKKIF
jgi:hypothetical protein